MLSNGVTVEGYVAASPAAIFDLLADPSRHRDLDGSGTLRGATKAPSRLSLGARFGMNMKAGAPYTMVNEVVEFETDRRIAWQARPTVALAAKVVGGRIYRYELTPKGDGTLVRQTWDISSERIPPLVWGLRGPVRRSMERTLHRIEKLT
ncbi:MAG: SRPBCC family protein [Actinomycetota bacterium]|nr:SRPBCC family protein [Actinomycetota bacterium]